MGDRFTPAVGGEERRHVLAGDPVNSKWAVTGQAAFSDTVNLTGSALQGTAYWTSIEKAGRKLYYSFNYTDIGADFRAPLGFVPRTDIRQAISFATLRWRPKDSPLSPSDRIRSCSTRGTVRARCRTG